MQTMAHGGKLLNMDEVIVTHKHNFCSYGTINPKLFTTKPS